MTEGGNCIFRLCNASLTMVVEQAIPGDDELTVIRIPMHPLGGHEEFGNCPASLMGMPPTTYTLEQMEAQAQVIERMIRDRHSGQAIASESEKRPPEHSKTPHPGKDPSWFRWNPGGGPSTGPQGYDRIPPIGILPADSSPAVKGLGVASVEEVKRVLSRALVLLAGAQSKTVEASGSVAEALELINFARETSVDPMGAPQAVSAAAKLDEAIGLIRAAIEAAGTYRDSM